MHEKGPLPLFMYMSACARESKFKQKKRSENAQDLVGKVRNYKRMRW